MGTDKKLEAAIALIKKRGYAKPKKKKPVSNLYFRLAYLFGYCSTKIKKPVTKRKVTMAAANSKKLDAILDEFHTGKKRAAFDDATDKNWTLDHYTKDIETNGQYKSDKHIVNY